MRIYRLALVLVFGLLSACQATTRSSVPRELESVLVTAPPNTANIPALAERTSRIANHISAKTPALTLEGLAGEAALAQATALGDARVQAALRAPDGSQMRNEVFQVRPAGAADIPSGTACASCMLVQIYMYATNSTLTVITSGTSIANIALTPNSQPEVPKAIADLAVQIAINTPDTARALGFAPEQAAALMPEMKTALNATKCERAMHLCVAPTFKDKTGNALLWAIVDMTDFRVVGLQWTTLDADGSAPVTEKTIENKAISDQYCLKDTRVERAGWSFSYRLTASDGLETKQIAFKGALLIDSIKTVDWHVSYSGSQQFGYSDSTGCPMFSTAAVPSYEPPAIVDVQDAAGQLVGFALIQDFKHPIWPSPCSYFYQQRTEFYNDGSIRPMAVSFGRGCGTDGTYRPIIRIGLANRAWATAIANRPQAVEYMAAARDSAAAPGQPWATFTTQIDGKPNSYALVALDTGGEHKASAYLYISAAKPNEGAVDLPTIGTCCNADLRQGPDSFVNNEPIGAGAIVIWYVGEMHNSAAKGHENCWAESRPNQQGLYEPTVWPCQAGPLLKPSGGA